MANSADAVCRIFRGRQRLSRFMDVQLQAFSPASKSGAEMADEMIDRKILDEIIRRIADAAQPQRIILFGSAARGDMGPNSDVDLLVVKEGADALDVTFRIYENLHAVGAAVDAVVVSPDDVERYKDSHALVIKPALQEGKVVYEAP